MYDPLRKSEFYKITAEQRIMDYYYHDFTSHLQIVLEQKH